MSDGSEPFKNPLDPVPARFKKIEGIERLKRAIQKENASPTEACSNLPHLLSVFQYIQKSSQEPSAVLKSFPFNESKSRKLMIDIVSARGDEWVKVSARNPHALELLAAGGGGYNSKSIIDHAKDYLKCAKTNECLFKPPQVIFYFASGIGHSLAKKLESLGVQVEGIRIEDDELKTHERIRHFEDIQPSCDNQNETDSSGNIIENQLNVPNSNFVNPDLKNIHRLNLDITAFLCFVSNLTNGHTSIAFKKPILEQQRQFEISRPQKHILDAAMEGKELYCCETAYREFLGILEVVGGEEEKKRADELLKRVTVVPDQRTSRSQKLFEGTLRGHLKKRSLTIFATGDAIEAVTLTANIGFVRSAKTQGIDFQVFVHESRALTEGKELWESKKKEPKTQ